MQVSIYLPPLRQLKGIVDRMKALDNFVVRGQVELTLVVKFLASADGSCKHERHPAVTDSNECRYSNYSVS